MEDNMNNVAVEETMAVEENNEVLQGEVVEQESGNKAAAIALGLTGVGGLIVGAVILTKKVVIPALRKRKEAKFHDLPKAEDKVETQEAEKKESN